MTPTLSFEADQVTVAVEPETVAVTLAGTLGGVWSPVTTAEAWADGALRFVPSEAITL